MRIPRQHLKRLVTRDCSDFHRIKTLLKKPTGGLVPEVMEMKPGDPRFLTSLGEVLGDRIQSDIPDLSVDPSEV